MATVAWLRKAWRYGYTSGNVLTTMPGIKRRYEEWKIGASYREVFRQSVLPHVREDSAVLELGPGRGSWTKALLQHIPRGVIHTVDFLDVAPWLKPEQQRGRLFCHQVQNNGPYAFLNDGFFDFCWSFGVLCHNNTAQLSEILRYTLPKMKPGAIAIHQYGDWDRLERYGWSRGGVPKKFKNLPDEKIWWPRNNPKTMSAIAESAGWNVLKTDLGLLKRDSMIVLQKPPAGRAET